MEKDTRGLQAIEAVRKETLTNIVGKLLLTIDRYERLQELSDELYYKFNRKTLERKLNTECQEFNNMPILDALDHCNGRLMRLADSIADGIIDVSNSIE